MFTDSKYMTAREKELTLKAWQTFLKHGLKAEHFTKGLYHHLMQHCEFIAHYDRAGFYSVYFTSGDQRAHFLSQFDGRGPCESIEYGSSRWRLGDYADINTAMIEAAAQYIPALLEHASKSQRDSDLTAARTLAAKYGAKVTEV